MTTQVRREVEVFALALCAAAVIVWRFTAPVVACAAVAAWVILFGGH